MSHRKICFHCKEEMILAENDVIYGKEWYHKTCWDSGQERIVSNTGNYLIKNTQ